MHERTSLAAALQNYFALREDGAPSGYVGRATPSLEAIRGTLQAYEDQTASFEWRNLLLSAAASLGLEETDIYEPIPPVILQGLLSMVPLAQQLHRDRLIAVDSRTGLCSLFFFIYVILCLRVLVIM